MSPEVAEILRTEPLKPIDHEYIKEAIRTHPEGKFCYKCGRINDNADDCGWWYKRFMGKIEALCRKCFPWEDHHGDR